MATRAKLSAAVQKYIELTDRLDSARMERETAQAAFKFRYSVIQPPEMPLRPTKPNVLLIVLGGLVASLALAIAAAAARDLRRAIDSSSHGRSRASRSRCSRR